MEEFGQEDDKYPLYILAFVYMKQVRNLLQFMGGTRDHNWSLYLASLEKICLHLRVQQAQLCLEYYKSVNKYVPTRNQWIDLRSGEFVINQKLLHSHPLAHITPRSICTYS